MTRWTRPRPAEQEPSPFTSGPTLEFNGLLVVDTRAKLGDIGTFVFMRSLKTGEALPSERDFKALTCPLCDGSGILAKCVSCKGRGEDDCQCSCGDLHDSSCRECDGEGVTKTCHFCDASGRVVAARIAPRMAEPGSLPLPFNRPTKQPPKRSRRRKAAA